MSMRIDKPPRTSSRSKAFTSPYLRSVYEQLNQQIDKILGDVKPTADITISYQRLYRFVEFLCRDKQQSLLAANLFDKFDKFLTVVVESLRDIGTSVDETEVLNKFVELSHIVNIKAAALEKIHLYLDRTYLLKHPSKSTFVKYSQLSYLTKLNDIGDLTQAINTAFALTMSHYRDTGNAELVPLLKETFQIQDKLLRSKELEGFEVYVIEGLNDYYNNAHIYLIENGDLSEVFERIYKLILQELAFWDETSDSNAFKDKVKYELVLCLIFNNFNEDGIKYIKPLFVNKKFLQISKLFKFIKHGALADHENVYLKTFSNIWYSYVFDYLQELLKDNPPDIVDKLVKSKKNLTLVMESYMDNNSEVEFKLREGFRTSLHASNKDSEILNKLLKYIDSFFKSATIDDHEQNLKVIDDIMLIFKSVKTKITFIKQYQRDLSRRLITDTSKDIELEKELVVKIQDEVGHEQCKPLITMFDDMDISDDLCERFKRQLPAKERDDYKNFNPLVLNSKAWPVPKSTIIIPDKLKVLMTRFQKFYLLRNEKKKLNWSPALSYMTVTGHFKKGNKDLHVSTFQGIVLLLLNEHDILSFEQIKELAGLDSRSLSGILHSLTNGKYKILIKEPDGRYSMNEDFEDRRKVIKIRQIQMKLKSGEEEDVWMQDNDETMYKSDKDEIIRAFIVRNMKNETTMNHDVLVKKVVDEFIIDALDVKRNIQVLLDGEYILREGTDTYQYIP